MKSKIEQVRELLKWYAGEGESGQFKIVDKDGSWVADFAMFSDRAKTALSLISEIEKEMDNDRLITAMKPLYTEITRLVDGWQKYPTAKRHPFELGVTIKTNCGSCYEIYDALRAASQGEG